MALCRYRALNRLALRTKLPILAAEARGALVYLKHDSMGPRGDAAILVFNPGAAQRLSIDLSLLPPSLLTGQVVPHDLLTPAAPAAAAAAAAPPPALARNWTIDIGAMEMRFYAGFTMGVFAPRRGKVSVCLIGLILVRQR
eukprot:COSAG01_NODE_1651_length_9623_cov_6.232045_4_plen_141_part_00